MNKLLNLPLRKILKDQAVPTLNLTKEGKNPRKRQAAENRFAFASKRARAETVEAQREIVNDLLLQNSARTKDAEVQVSNEGASYSSITVPSHL